MAEPEPEVTAEGASSPRSTFIQALGGWRGLVDSALPATAFVVVRQFSGGIAYPAIAALVVGLGVVALRRVHGLSQRQAWGGFFGLAVAVVVARATGRGEDFFVPGILTTALCGCGLTVSLLIRRPAVGFALAAYDNKYERWREHEPLRRACAIATAVWAVTFFIRSGVAAWVYEQPGDSDGTLLIVTNAVKWPLMAGAALLTVALVRRAGPPPQPAA